LGRTQERLSVELLARGKPAGLSRHQSRSRCSRRKFVFAARLLAGQPVGGPATAIFVAAPNLGQSTITPSIVKGRDSHSRGYGQNSTWQSVLWCCIFLACLDGEFAWIFYDDLELVNAAVVLDVVQRHAKHVNVAGQSKLLKARSKVISSVNLGAACAVTQVAKTVGSETHWDRWTGSHIDAHDDNVGLVGQIDNSGLLQLQLMIIGVTRRHHHLYRADRVVLSCALLALW